MKIKCACGTWRRGFIIMHFWAGYRSQAGGDFSGRAFGEKLIYSFIHGGKMLAPFWLQRVESSRWNQPQTTTALTANRRANQRWRFVDSLSDELRGFRTQKWRWSPPRQLQESLWNIAYTALPTSYFAAVSIKELNYIWVAATSMRAKLDFSLENKLQTTSLLCRHSLANM